MKLVLAGWYPSDPQQIAGGPVYNNYVQAQTLKERDDVKLFVVSRSKEFSDHRVHQEGNAEFHFVGEPRRRLVPRQLTIIPRLTRVLRALAPDVVVSHHYTETLAAMNAGCVTIHMVHGISRDEMPHARGLERLKFRLQVWLDRKAIHSVKHLICISNYGAKACREQTSARIHIISYPIVEDVFFQSQPYSDGKAILSAGVIYPLKNTLALVQAMPIVMKEHPDAKLRICGRVQDPGYLAQLRAFVAANGLSEAVEFMGLVSRDEIIRCLSDSVCLALPSRQENTPNVIAQAMAAGRAVVASPVGGVPEMVDEGITGFLVQPDDSECLAEKICRLMRDTDLARRMGVAGREKAMRRHERHAHIEQLLQICSEAISARG